MRRRVWGVILMLALTVMPLAAQETRGNINGTIQDAGGVLPGATVKITNVDTNQTQSLLTNGSGYFEAPLLPPGTYRATVEMPGFGTQTQNLVLSAGQALSLKFTLSVGQLSEQVTVKAEAPLLDTTSVSSGQNYDRALIEGLPLAANQPMLLARFAQGVSAPSTQPPVLNGQIDGPTNSAGDPIGGVGGFSYTIDGATNAGNNRRLASSPNADVVQEIRVETSNFDASVGHGIGASIALVTKAGTNTYRGTATHQYWTNKLNSIAPQQKLAFAERPATGDLYKKGNSQYGVFTFGGPLVRDKMFFFGNYQANVDNAGQRTVQTSTIPANAKHLNGDFSDLLTLGSPGQYQIYDPLTVRPDPARPGSFIRTPFPNNMIPTDRFMNADGSYKNPLFALYKAMTPTPNQNFVEQGSIPQNNYYQGGVPNRTTASAYGFRLDYNHSESDRVFFRSNWTQFHEAQGDWTFEVDKYKGTHTNDKTRASWAYSGNWTKVLSGKTVVDTLVSTNRFFEDQQRRGLHDFKPSDVGLPTYLDDFCKAAQNCMLPRIQVGGYQAVSNTADGGLDSTNVQAQSSVSSIRSTHTLRGGAEYRLAMRRNNLITAGDVSSTYVFDNTFTRAADTTSVFPASNIGLSLASLMLGIPTQVSIGANAPLSMRNPYYAGYFQDTWRATPNLTLNFGLRYEFEDGIKESENRWITEFKPDAVLAISQLAQDAYARSPIPQLPASQFRPLGGAVYATAPGASDKTWKGQSMWMPRFSASYKLGSMTVAKTAYGLFFDTLNAADYINANQLGYTATTTNVSSTDFGQTWLLGNPAAGVLPIVNPFPVRPDGSRFESAIGDSLGAETILGTAFTRENPDRQRARVQRWRVGIQRELPGRMAIEVAYNGTYTDRADRAIQASFVPEQYYSSVTNVRDNSAQSLLQQQVTNPFFIDNFASLKTSNAALYQRLAGNAFFTARTVQRQQLLRSYPQLSGLTFNNLPLGIVKAHSLEVTVNRRYSSGLSANLAFSANRVVENRTVELYEQKPTLWQTSQNARPWRLSGSAVYELPFGAGRPFLENGGIASAILGGWQTGGTVEYQPGALLEWGNLFFNGNLDDIKKDKPEIALRRDGTIDPTKTWINTDAGFEKNAAAQPAQFQKRSFPFRVDGVRGPGFFLVNMNVVRTFSLPKGANFQFRVDIQNLFDSVLWSNPDLNPTSTNFGKITTHPNSIMRFFTFVSKVTF